MLHRSLVVGAIGLTTFPAAAVRLDFEVTLNGSPASAEICSYRSPGVGGTDPVAKYFADDHVKCLPADKILAFPEGHWSFFARRGHEAVSHGSYMAKVKGTADAGYKKVHLEMFDAISVDFVHVLPDLKPGEFFAVYFPSDKLRLASALPLPRGATRLQVPRDKAWIPVISNGETLLALGQRRVSSADVTLETQEFTARAETFDIAGWLEWGAGDRAYVTNSPAPKLTLTTSAGVVVSPLAEPGSVDSDGLFIFKGVPRHGGSLTLEGHFWEAKTLPVRPVQGALTMMAPIPAVPAGGISLTVLSPVTSHHRATCNQESDAEPDDRFVIALSRCSTPIDGLSEGELRNAGSCDVIRSNSVEPDSLKEPVVFESLPEGTYRVEVRPPVGPSRYQMVSVEAARFSNATFDTAAANVYGRVIHRGKPLAAKVEFASGAGFTHPDTGEYVAAVSADPGQRFITISSCDAAITYRFIPSQSVKGGEFHEFTIPDTAVHVTARDQADGRAINKAKASAEAVEEYEGKPTVVRSPWKTTDTSGETIIHAVPLHRDLKVCIRHDDYEPQCKQTRVNDSNAVAQVAFELRRVPKTEGRITSPFPLGSALLMWVDPSGAVTEETGVADDGTFRFARPHSESEAVVIVSRQHPLAAFHPGVSGDGAIHIEVPNAAMRSLQVLVSEGGEPNPGIELRVGTVMVPPRAFSLHQVTRGLQPSVIERGPLPIPEILATGPVSVLRGPDETRMAEPLTPSVACTRPEYKASCHIVPAASDGIVFLP